MYRISLSKGDFSGEKHSWVVASMGPKSITAFYDYDTDRISFRIKTVDGVCFDVTTFKSALEYFNDN